LALGRRGDYTNIVSEHTGQALTFAQQKIEEYSKQNAGSENQGNDTTDKLRELRDLHEEGVLTDEEFELKKEELLDDF
jgi:hypothetical protein